METIKYVLAFLVEHQKEVEVLSDAAGVITLLLTSCALIFTGRQIYRNISQTRAMTVYTIQKDAREFLFELEKQPEVMKSLFSQEIDKKTQVQNRIGSVFNFYAAIHQQHRMKVLDDRIWRNFENELRVLVQSDDARSFWEQKRQSGQYDKAYSALIDRLIREGTNVS